MNRTIPLLLLIGACGALLPGASGALLPGASAVSDDGDKPDHVQSGAVVSISPEQQQAIGIVVARPPAIKAPEQIEAFGLVLDPEPLITEVGDMAAAQAAEQATRGELERLRALHGAGGDASLKMIEAAQAEQAKTRSQWQLASARFCLRWGPLAALPAAEREKILESLTRGNGLLVRADILGRQAVSVIPHGALLAVDGVRVPGRVLGVLRQANELQSVGLLIALDHVPVGLSAGARLPVTLLSAQRSGRLVGRDAIFYDEKGAYVYVKLAGQGGNEVKFRASRVTLLFASDDGWLVDGIDADGDVVMHGAGALWSLQEMRGAADDDDD